MRAHHRCLCPALLLLAALLTACAAPQDTPIVKLTDRARVLAMQGELRGRHPNLGGIAVARLRVGGEPLEVTSVLPVTVAAVTNDNGPSYTIFLFSPDREQLVLFTRDPVTGDGFRAELARAKWQPGWVIHFPVIEPGGAVASTVIELSQVIER